MSIKYANRALFTAVLAALAGVASAQTAPAKPEPELQEIVVTGSMIKRVNAETAEAITILKADALKDQGIVNVEQAMNTLTSANPSLNIASAVGTFSGGGTYADLRGLGNGRTLVLLDGERVAPNAFNGLGVDLRGGDPERLEERRGGHVDLAAELTTVRRMLEVGVRCDERNHVLRAK